MADVAEKAEAADWVIHDDVVIHDDPDVAGLRWVTLNRARSANALSDQMVTDLGAAITQAYADGVRVLALDSLLRHFCAGLDLRADTETDHRDAVPMWRITRIAALLEEVRTAGLVTAVVVNGAAVGAGADLSLACHYRVGVDGASWKFPGVRFGVALGTTQLAQIVGGDRAREILLGQRTVTTDQAAAWGMVHEVAADAAAGHDVVRRFAERVAALDPAAVGAVLAATASQDRDTPVGVLARSASHGSLGDRLDAYRAATSRGR